MEEMILAALTHAALQSIKAEMRMSKSGWCVPVRVQQRARAAETFLDWLVGVEPVPVREPLRLAA